MDPMLIGTIVGNIGIVCFLAAYFLLQKGTWKAHGFAYLFSNFCGSVLLMASLMIDWNLPAFLLEAAWCLISIYGLIKYFRARSA